MSELTGLGDQVQQMLQDSGLPVIAFVLIDIDGRAEYRAKLSTEELREVLGKVAEAL